MTLPVTSLFAGLFALYFVRLAFAVIRLRRSNKVALGAGGVAELEGAIRAHGNFAEYVPLGLILLGLFESHSVHPMFVAVLGGLLALGRVLHAQALSKANLKLRVRGMMLTFGTLTTLAVLNIVFAVRVWVGHLLVGFCSLAKGKHLKLRKTLASVTQQLRNSLPADHEMIGQLILSPTNFRQHIFAQHCTRMGRLELRISKRRHERKSKKMQRDTNGQATPDSVRGR